MKLFSHSFRGRSPFPAPGRAAAGGSGGTEPRVSTGPLPLEVSLTPSALHLRSGARWQGRARDSPGSAGRWRPAPAGGCPEGTARLQWSSCTPYRPPAAQRARGGHGGDRGSAAGPRREKKSPSVAFLAAFPAVRSKHCELSALF